MEGGRVVVDFCWVSLGYLSFFVVGCCNMISLRNSWGTEDLG